jgi:MbtH protein
MAAARPTSGSLTIDGDEFVVLINGAEQYSISPSATPVPIGWSRVGRTGPKAECVAFVEKYWFDMRPRPLQNQMKRR